MKIFSVFKVQFEASEVCCICLKFLSWGTVAARADAKIAHYKCAKKRGWKRMSRAKKTTQKLEVAPKMIKVIRGAKVVKRVPVSK